MRACETSWEPPSPETVPQNCAASCEQTNGRRPGYPPSMRELAEGLWITERPQRFWGVEVGTRMTVVRLGGGGLFVHCPVALDAPTRRAVEALGEVRAVASPSLFHHLYAGQWMEAYPGAVFAACPGLADKRPDLAFGHVLSDTPHAAWAAELDQVDFSARFEKEVVFFHRASGTMITADALLNLSEHPSRSTRVVARLMGNTAPGKGWLEWTIAVKDKTLCRAQVDRMLRWDIDRIVLAHGGLVERGGREILRTAYAWARSSGDRPPGV